MTTTMTMRRSTISALLLLEAAVLALLLYAYAAFINVQIAALTAAMVVAGSLYSYARLVRRTVEAEAMQRDDAIDKIEDPYELYDDQETAPETAQELVAQEKQRLKSARNTAGAVKTGAPAMLSLFRIVPYLFLVAGFIGLKNNALLDLGFYLPGLAVGILAGFLAMRSLFK